MVRVRFLFLFSSRTGQLRYHKQLCLQCFLHKTEILRNNRKLNISAAMSKRMCSTSLRALVFQARQSARSPPLKSFHQVGLVSSSVWSSYPAHYPRPAPFAVVSRHGGWGQKESRCSVHARHLLDDGALGCLRGVRVSPAVYPRLQDLFDIPSTAQNSLCVCVYVVCRVRMCGV